MAILRGGTRIFGSDVRIGLSRDKSLENVTNDPRLRQKPGGDRQSTMGRFHSYVSEAEGMARKCKFYTSFQLPKGHNGIASGFNPLYNTTPPVGSNQKLASEVGEEGIGFSQGAQLRAVESQHRKRVQAFCKDITMPPRMTKMTPHQIYGPARQMVTGMSMADEPVTFTATFMCDKFLRERTYFELWQQAGINTNSFNVNYYDEYISPVEIFQLGGFEGAQERNSITYAVSILDCYPTSIGEITYSSAEDALVEFTVTFAYRYWINYFIDKAGQIQIGDSDFKSPEIKAGGPLGGLLGNLPAPLRRAGRDVISDLKRRLPIGDITGGRVFPPFNIGGGFIPPINI